jgi:hypothetical protein
MKEESDSQLAHRECKECQRQEEAKLPSVLNTMTTPLPQSAQVSESKAACIHVSFNERNTFLAITEKQQ